ncbi:hypothetical protein EAF00_012055 [Botryotinia globosa]|nr:hypothetical protein EAF00_012055 [Botryotinia globosa]
MSLPTHIDKHEIKNFTQTDRLHWSMDQQEVILSFIKAHNFNSKDESSVSLDQLLIDLDYSKFQHSKNSAGENIFPMIEKKLRRKIGTLAKGLEFEAPTLGKRKSRRAMASNAIPPEIAAEALNESEYSSVEVDTEAQIPQITATSNSVIHDLGSKSPVSAPKDLAHSELANLQSQSQSQSQSNQELFSSRPLRQEDEVSSRPKTPNQSSTYEQKPSSGQILNDDGETSRPKSPSRSEHVSPPHDMPPRQENLQPLERTPRPESYLSHIASNFFSKRMARPRSPPKTTSRFENLQESASSLFDTEQTQPRSQMSGMRNGSANGNVDDGCSVHGLRRDALEDLRDRNHDDRREELQGNTSELARDNRREPSRNNRRELVREPSLMPGRYSPISTTQFMHPAPRSPHTSPLIRAASRLSHTGNGIASRTYSTPTPTPEIGPLSRAASRISSRAGDERAMHMQTQAPIPTPLSRFHRDPSDLRAPFHSPLTRIHESPSSMKSVDLSRAIDELSLSGVDYSHNYHIPHQPYRQSFSHPEVRLQNLQSSFIETLQQGERYAIEQMLEMQERYSRELNGVMHEWESVQKRANELIGEMEQLEASGVMY